MKEKLNFIERFKISIFKPRRYNELIKQGIFKAITYSLIISLIIGSIIGGIIFSVLSSAEKDIYNIVSNKSFEFSISNGIFEFNKSPVKFDEGKSVIYIDSDISINDINSIKNIVVHKDYSVAILKDGIAVRYLGDEYTMEYNSIINNLSLNNETLIKALNLFKFVKYFIFISTVFSIYFMFMINSVILSVIGLVVSRVNNIKIGYRDLLKISIYATTLPIILNSLIPLGALGIFISGIYLIIVINSLRINKIV